MEPTQWQHANLLSAAAARVRRGVSEGVRAAGGGRVGVSERLHEQRWTVADLPDEEALKALGKIEGMLRAAERDARLLDGREFKERKWAEAYRLVGLLRERAGG